MEPPGLPDHHFVVNDPFERILGGSAAAEAVRVFGRRAAAVDASVLLLGESGTGKGVLARLIHEASARARGAFVAVNCAAVPDALFESEFFGHVRGAFTGAQYAHKGLFEQAHGGTLFLDEIGELPPAGQAKLLTTIEDRLVRRVGGERQSLVSVRVIAATARDLHAATLSGNFRIDLLHRLAVLSYSLPPLRERSDDLEEIANHFLELFAERYNRGLCFFDDGAIDLLRRHAWAGNFRELANVVEASVVASNTNAISVTASLRRISYRVPSQASPASFSNEDERSRIAHALRRCHGNKTQAARLLGMARTTLWLKMKNLESEGVRDDVEKTSDT